MIRAVHAPLSQVGVVLTAPSTTCTTVIALVCMFLPVPPLLVTLALLVMVTGVALRVADEAEKQLGHDAKPIVIEEAVGQSLALLFVPHAWWAFAAAFVLFRLFDVWKPLGAREAQALPGGLGVVADDVIAGITACAAFHVGMWGLRRAGIAL